MSFPTMPVNCDDGVHCSQQLPPPKNVTRVAGNQTSTMIRNHNEIFRTCATVQPASSQAATTALIVVCGHCKPAMQLSYVPWQAQMADGLVGLAWMHVCSVAPHACRDDESQASGAGTDHPRIFNVVDDGVHWKPNHARFHIN
jgi:hypothetical protein